MHINRWFKATSQWRLLGGKLDDAKRKAESRVRLKASSNMPKATVWWISLSLFLLLELFVFVPLPTFSAGAMLPEGGAGALRCHETIRQSGGTDGTRQIHREPCVLVCGRRGKHRLEPHPAEEIWKPRHFLFILFNTSSLEIPVSFLYWVNNRMT